MDMGMGIRHTIMRLDLGWGWSEAGLEVGAGVRDSVGLGRWGLGRLRRMVRRRFMFVCVCVFMVGF